MLAASKKQGNKKQGLRDAASEYNKHLARRVLINREVSVPFLASLRAIFNLLPFSDTLIKVEQAKE